MKSVSKVAVSIPKETLRRLERVAKRMRRSRSAAVALAIEEWLRAHDVSKADRLYAEAYLREPEPIAEVAAIAAAATASWEPWK